jgi:hypothetical protein
MNSITIRIPKKDTIKEYIKKFILVSPTIIIFGTGLYLIFNKSIIVLLIYAYIFLLSIFWFCFIEHEQIEEQNNFQEIEDV